MLVFIPSKIFKKQENVDKFYAIMEASEEDVLFDITNVDLLKESLKEMGENAALNYYVKITQNRG